MNQPLNATELATLLTAPKRRDVAEMAANIAELDDNGSDVVVLVKHRIFGVYQIAGTTSRAVTGDFVLGSQSIEIGGKPVASVLRVAAGRKVPTASGDVTIDVPHGAIIRASFDRNGEEVTIVGHVVHEQDGRCAGVGRWLINSRERPSRFLVAMDVLAMPLDVPVHCPAPQWWSEE